MYTQHAAVNNSGGGGLMESGSLDTRIYEKKCIHIDAIHGAQ